MSFDDSLEQHARTLASALPPPLASGRGPLFVARAPFRLDVLGGATRFAGSAFVAYPTATGVTVAVRAAREDEVIVHGLLPPGAPESGRPDPLAVPLSWLADPAELARLRDREPHVTRVVRALARVHERVGRPPAGVAVHVRWNLPPDASLASGEALVAATARAFAAHLGVDVEGLAALVADVERECDAFSAPCDAHAVGDARAGRFLPFLAQPCEVLESVAAPGDLEPVAFLLGEGPVAVSPLRTAAAMAYRVMAARMGLTVVTRERGDTQDVEDPFYDGWLANCDPVTFTNEFRDALPERLRGETFLDAYGGVADPAVRVEADVEYSVRDAAGYVLAEHQRACAFVDALHRATRGGASGATGEELGALLVASEREARGLGVGSSDAARLVDALLRRGSSRGVRGARAATPGTVVALVRPDDESARALEEAVAEWERGCGRAATLVRGTSTGAAAAESALALDLSDRAGASGD